MIDTVILTIPKGKYRILEPQRFAPSASVAERVPLLRCVNNPTGEDKRRGVYKPRLTLMQRPTKRGVEIPLKIEFSIPKLLWNNNVDEVEEEDFSQAIDELSRKLFDMGVAVSKTNLRTANVTAFHPSKNIILKDGYTATFVIKELHKINLSKKLDLNKTDFRNGGQSIQYNTNSYSLVIYDKVQDLRKPEKRAIDKDQNSTQKSLFEILKPSRLEILRIELRLAKKVKMNADLVKLGYNPNPTFQDIFRNELCQKAISHYWQKIVENNNLFLFNMDSGPRQTLRTLLRNNKTIAPKRAIYLTGLATLCREEGGIRDLRAILAESSTNRTWHRIAEDLKQLNHKQNLKSYHGWVGQVSRQITEFKSIKCPLLTCKQK